MPGSDHFSVRRPLSPGCILKHEPNRSALTSCTKTDCTGTGLEVRDSLVVAALSGWGLLATTISRVYVATQMMVQHLRTFRELLASSDMEVRVEAGENLALLHESRLIVGLSYPGDTSSRGGEPSQGTGVADGADGEDDGVSGEGTGDAGGDGDDGEAEQAMELASCWEEVVEEIKGFITESSKKVRARFTANLDIYRISITVCIRTQGHFL